MTASTARAHTDGPPWIDFYLLGEVGYDQFLALQRRLAYELGGEARPRMLVLMCEHEPLITVGRAGSRGHIRLTGEQLRRRRLDVRWVARGGGCVLHGPGQLAVYPLIPLERLERNLGWYLQRMRHGFHSALQSLGIPTRPGETDFGLWGRSGQLIAPGVAVRNGVTQYGWYLNVNPSMGNAEFVRTANPCPWTAGGLPLESASAGDCEKPLATEQKPVELAARTQQTMGCLVAERSQPTRMTEVRGALVEHLTTSLAADHYNVYSSHPWLPRSARAARESHTRAS